MRFIVCLPVSVALAFVASAGANIVSDSDVDFLLASAAKDFRAQNQLGTLRFRNVRAGHIPLSEGEINPLLCGEYQSAAKEWTPFATIKTDGYEQWNGAQSATFCTNASTQWDEGRDLTEMLQRRFNAK